MTVWRTADPAASLDASEDAATPRETTFADAQSDTNFVVLEPNRLPDDCRVGEVTLRPEQPPGRPGDVTAEDIGQTPHSDGNPCSVRAMIEGESRRLRLKAFLYDWAPPAASIAPLWRTDDPTPVTAGDEVGWLGTDYMGRRGACVQRDRTQVELSVVAGEFSDDELRTVLDGLTPADPDGAAAVRAVPFHRLNYWVRYRCPPVAVSHGVWDYAPTHPYGSSRPLSPVELATNAPAGDAAAGDTNVRPLVPSGDGYVLDSAVAFPDEDAVECVFRRRENASDHLWLIAAGADSSLAPDLPPQESDQSAGARRRLDLRGTTGHYGALTEDHGAWEATWEEGGVRYAAWAGSSQFLDGAAFRSLVDGFEAP
ncbi:hypothetical protein [Halorarum halobium]|uniref:hypothetical protein n=1 Tax=Halorarum halobium TaxID=3075121 RepID=UPI0028A93907|nr:hypothetical protein [Halobaculum sp. XH14]